MPANQITDLLILEPVSDIFYIEKGNKGEAVDSLGLVSSELWLAVINANKGRLPNPRILSKLSHDDRAYYSSEVKQMFIKAEDKKNNSSLKLSPYFFKLMEENNSRFLMLSYLNGFTRRKGNMGGQMAKSIGLGVLTMGMYTQIPYKASSNLYVLIVDKETSKIAFCKKSFVPEKEPLDYKILQKQFNQVFKKYF